MDDIFNSFDEQTKKNILSYLDNDYDKEIKDEINNLLKTDPEALKNAFFQKLSFGTGGIRGLMGLGTNRINKYTIRTAAQGLANYLKVHNSKKENKNISVFIGYDNRKNSKFFAKQTACVLANNKIKVFLFKTLCPTPIVSFGCRLKKCSAAIMITASHNPKEYNGFKVYWNDGAQVVEPHDKGIIKEFNAISDASKIKLSSIDDSFIEWVEEEIFVPYLKALNNLNFDPQNTNDLNIIYTSLHGAGITITPRALENWGFKNIHLVEKQCVVDENFSYASPPNPEEKTALQMGIDLLLEKKADILLATDPDADRLALVIVHKNNPIILTGNQTACILVEYLCSLLSSKNKLTKKAAFVKSIVTTELFCEIVKSYNRACFNVLTGFKYIAQKIRQWEESSAKSSSAESSSAESSSAESSSGESSSFEFIFGAEESLGFLTKDFVRDKDATSSACLLAQIAQIMKKNNQTLLDYLYQIYKKYGIYRETLFSLSFEEGEKGMTKMHKLMSSLRAPYPKMFANYEVASIEDYKTRERVDLKTKNKSPLSLPISDVLTFWLDDGSKIVIRPSGTEPKVKIYVGVCEKNIDNLEEKIKLCDERLKAISQVVKNMLIV